MRHTSPYNPQSNPVERVMRELGRIIRAYAHERQTRWARIIPRAERIINVTKHRSTGQKPVELHEQLTLPRYIEPNLIPRRVNNNKSLEEKIEHARRALQARQEIRKKQANKKGVAPEFAIDDKVWVKLHRRSDASRKLTKKIHLVYEGPYRVRQVVRRNPYLIETMEGEVLGVYNSRQLRPHRQPRLKPKTERE